MRLEILSINDSSLLAILGRQGNIFSYLLYYTLLTFYYIRVV